MKRNIWVSFFAFSLFGFSLIPALPVHSQSSGQGIVRCKQIVEREVLERCGRLVAKSISDSRSGSIEVNGSLDQGASAAKATTGGSAKFDSNSITVHNVQPEDLAFDRENTRQCRNAIWDEVYQRTCGHSGQGGETARRLTAGLQELSRSIDELKSYLSPKSKWSTQISRAAAIINSVKNFRELHDALSTISSEIEENITIAKGHKININSVLDQNNELKFGINHDLYGAIDRIETVSIELVNNIIDNMENSLAEINYQRSQIGPKYLLYIPGLFGWDSITEEARDEIDENLIIAQMLDALIVPAGRHVAECVAEGIDHVSSYTSEEWHPCTCHSLFWDAISGHAVPKLKEAIEIGGSFDSTISYNLIEAKTPDCLENIARYKSMGPKLISENIYGKFYGR